MTENTPRVPLGAWLADLPDERLVRLLELRPDLTQPPPGSIAALAARAQARQSVKAASDDLDFLALAVLDALLVLHADTTAVPPAKLASLIGDRVPEGALTAALDALQERALVWGDAALRVVAEAPAALPWYPGQVTLEDTERTVEEITAAIDALDDAQRQLLDRLLAGSPVGRTRDAAPGTPPDRPVQRLLAAGLLRQVDDETVILPRVVGQVLRGEQPGPISLAEPTPAVSTTAAADVDAAAAGAVIDLLRETELIIETLGCRTGSRAAQRRPWGPRSQTADQADGHRRAAAGHAPGNRRRGGADRCRAFPGQSRSTATAPYWAPTVQADRFTDSPAAERWHLLATTWLDARRRGRVWRADAGPTTSPSPRCRMRCSPPPRRSTGGCFSACWPGCRSGPGSTRRRRRECCCGDVRAGHCGCSRGRSPISSTRRRHWAWSAAPR